MITSGALAEADTRMLTTAVLTGALAQRSDEAVNLVNARAVAEGRGIRVLGVRRSQRGRLHQPADRARRPRRVRVRHDDRPRQPLAG